MKIYLCKGNQFMGFYRECGSTVRIVGTRTIMKRQWICKMVLDEYLTPSDLRLMKKWIPGHYESRTFTVLEHEEERTRLVTEHFEERTETTPAHWGTREYWLEPHTEILSREVPGHFEVKTEYVQGHFESQTVYEPGEWVETSVWKSGYWESYLVTRPADPETGRLEVTYEDKRWVEGRYYTRKVWVEGRSRLVAVWVEGEYKDVEVWIPTYTESYEVEIPGCWQERRIWFPDVTRTYQVLVPEHEETYMEVIPEYTEVREVWIPIREIEVTVEYGKLPVTEEREVCKWEDVEFEDPIFEKVFDEDFEKYDLIAEDRTVVRISGFEQDSITIRNVDTGLQYQWECEFVGYASRMSDNKYVVPVED